MSNSVLTIAIPTYNRAALLDKCLAAIAAQLTNMIEQVELLVSDNASTDDTRLVVEKYQALLPSLAYYKNDINLGPDFNIAKCFELAQTDYVWIFSDDDILLPDTLFPIVGILQKREVGLLYLTPTWYSKDVADATILKEAFVSKVYANALEFCEEVNYWVTFISSNIVKKSLFKEQLPLKEYKATNLIQLRWTLPAIFKAKVNGKVFTRVVLGRATEGVDYRFFTVFSRNINEVMKRLLGENIIPADVIEIINKKLIINFFPQYLVAEKEFINNEKPFYILFSVFKKYKEFYTILLPLFLKRLYAKPVKKISDKLRSAVVQTYQRIENFSNYQKGQNTLRSLKSAGINANLPVSHIFVNPHRVSIGRRFFAHSILRITVLENYGSNIFDPEVVIGDDVQLGYDCTINCINRIQIASQVLIADRVCLSDCTFSDQEQARFFPPNQRQLMSKGPITIGQGALIEDDVRIYGGVSIGVGAIVRAGSTVSSDVLAYSVVSGIV